MKKILAVLAAGLFVASLLPAQTTPAAKPAAPGSKPAAPGTTGPVKKEEEPKIPGTVINRSNGAFLGLEVVGGNFKLSFYDKKKKPVSPDVTRASARWPNPRSVTGPNRTVLNPSGAALVGSKPVLPPFTFTVHLTLLQGDGEDAAVVESYDVPVPK